MHAYATTAALSLSLASRLQSHRAVLEQTGRWLDQIMAAVESRGSRVEEIELCYDGTGFLVRDLGNAFEVVERVASVNWALLRMALNVWALPFQKDAELQMSLSKVAPTRANSLEDEPDPEAQRSIRRKKMAA